MSQHHFYTVHDKEKTHVFMGWDKLLQGYFLVIQKISDPSDKPYWCNLDKCDEPHPKKITPFLKVLRKLNIKIPKQMIEEIKQDAIQNVGNKEVVHEMTETGYWRTENIK